MASNPSAATPPQGAPISLHGPWLSSRDPEALEKQRAELLAELAKLPPPKDHPAITEFRNLIKTDPVVYLLINQMIDQIPPNPIYDAHRLKSPDEMLTLLNKVLTRAPDYNDTLLVGTPFSAIIVWTMGTPAGFAAYRNEKINAMFEKLLDAWAVYLDSPASLSVLNKGANGWMSEAAQAQLNMGDYQHQPDAPHWGFTSWNDFFTRQLAEGVRPIYEPTNPKAIVSACDSQVYRTEIDTLQREAKFWLKGEPYSLQQMLNNNEEFIPLFEGGSILQAFLSPLHYHRWHSPVKGVIKWAARIPGLYFSQADCMGEDPNDQDASQGYICQVQTRAIFMIESEEVGMVCVMPVGMVEISTCHIHKKIVPGYVVEKGEELGYFKFGGSTHCVFFQKGRIKEFTRTGNDSIQMGNLIAWGN